MVQAKTEALVIGEDTFLATNRQIGELAARHSIPAIGLLRQSVEVGLLVSYGTNLKDAYRLIGGYAGRILKGAKAADLPVQQPTKFEMVLNMKAATALGLTISPIFLAQVDEVIE
jgi:putative tryptophan/tyrosine transport system substrate-binding protein